MLDRRVHLRRLKLSDRSTISPSPSIGTSIQHKPKGFNVQSRSSYEGVLAHLLEQPLLFSTELARLAEDFTMEVLKRHCRHGFSVMIPCMDASNPEGIGRDIALWLVEDGLDITIAELKSQCTRLDVADEVEAQGRRCVVLECDVSPEGAQCMVRTTGKGFNGLNVVGASLATNLPLTVFQMVANTGQIIVKSVVDCKSAPSLIRFYGDHHTPKATLVNLDLQRPCARDVPVFATKVMIERGHCGSDSWFFCIWMIASFLVIGALLARGKKRMPLTSDFCASKLTIQSFTAVLASEIGPQGITVNAYAAPEQSIRVSPSHTASYYFLCYHNLPTSHPSPISSARLRRGIRETVEVS
ncbi:hypothetical protein BDR06DRAFT_1018389 [Suillus hirtellus]|nr:hypothetical protein BDR06DRAFT_1018389 [Suillus hirtellus]